MFAHQSLHNPQNACRNGFHGLVHTHVYWIFCTARANSFKICVLLRCLLTPESNSLEVECLTRLFTTKRAVVCSKSGWNVSWAGFQFQIAVKADVFNSSSNGLREVRCEFKSNSGICHRFLILESQVIEFEVWFWT